jgi:hypothetical protein
MNVTTKFEDEETTLYCNGKRKKTHPEKYSDLTEGSCISTNKSFSLNESELSFPESFFLEEEDNASDYNCRLEVHQSLNVANQKIIYLQDQLRQRDEQLNQLTHEKESLLRSLSEGMYLSPGEIEHILSKSPAERSLYQSVALILLRHTTSKNQQALRQNEFKQNSCSDCCKVTDQNVPTKKQSVSEVVFQRNQPHEEEHYNISRNCQNLCC